MTAIGQLKSASHFGISFPYSDLEVTLSHRHHVHIYIHTPGGEIEKLGRALYQFEFTIPAHDTLQPPYRNFYATKLPQLWSLWESGQTADAVIPNLGTVRAFAPTVKRSLRVQSQSGETVKLTLLEDQQALLAFSALFTPSIDSLPVQLKKFVLASQDIVELSLLDKLIAAIDDLIRLRDTIVLAARLVNAKIAGVIGLCEQIRQVPDMGFASNYNALSALISLHYTAVRVREDAQRRIRATSTRPVPASMSITQIAAWLAPQLGRSTGTLLTELFALNDWPNPLTVPRGSLVRFYV